MWPNPHETADLVISTDEILNGKLHFLCNDTFTIYPLNRVYSSIKSHMLYIKIIYVTPRKNRYWRFSDEVSLTSPIYNIFFQRDYGKSYHMNVSYMFKLNLGQVVSTEHLSTTIIFIIFWDFLVFYQFSFHLK